MAKNTYVGKHYIFTIIASLLIFSLALFLSDGSAPVGRIIGIESSSEEEPFDRTGLVQITSADQLPDLSPDLPTERVEFDPASENIINIEEECEYEITRPRDYARCTLEVLGNYVPPVPFGDTEVYAIEDLPEGVLSASIALDQPIIVGYTSQKFDLPNLKSILRRMNYELGFIIREEGYPSLLQTASPGGIIKDFACGPVPRCSEAGYGERCTCLEDEGSARLDACSSTTPTGEGDYLTVANDYNAFTGLESPLPGGTHGINIRLQHDGPEEFNLPSSGGLIEGSGGITAGHVVDETGNFIFTKGDFFACKETGEVIYHDNVRDFAIWFSNKDSYVGDSIFTRIGSVESENGALFKRGAVTGDTSGPFTGYAGRDEAKEHTGEDTDTCVFLTGETGEGGTIACDAFFTEIPACRGDSGSPIWYNEGTFWCDPETFECFDDITGRVAVGILVGASASFDEYGCYSNYRSVGVRLDRAVRAAELAGFSISLK